MADLTKDIRYIFADEKTKKTIRIHQELHPCFIQEDAYLWTPPRWQVYCSECICTVVIFSKTTFYLETAHG